MSLYTHTYIVVYIYTHWESAALPHLGLTSHPTTCVPRPLSQLPRALKVRSLRSSTFQPWPGTGFSTPTANAAEKNPQKRNGNDEKKTVQCVVIPIYPTRRLTWIFFSGWWTKILKMNHLMSWICEFQRGDSRSVAVSILNVGVRYHDNHPNFQWISVNTHAATSSCHNLIFGLESVQKLSMLQYVQK